MIYAKGNIIKSGDTEWSSGLIFLRIYMKYFVIRHLSNHKIFKNLASDILGTIGIEFLVLGPKFTKKLLKLIAISLSVTMLLTCSMK